MGSGTPPPTHTLSWPLITDCFHWLAVNWLDHSRTFREQGVEESETLLLRRKFFYSDQNVDSRDPVQLNLLYVQVNTLLCSSHSVLLPLLVLDQPAITRVLKVSRGVSREAVMTGLRSEPEPGQDVAQTVLLWLRRCSEAHSEGCS